MAAVGVVVHGRRGKRMETGEVGSAGPGARL